jgi:hypothetical protein
MIASSTALSYSSTQALRFTFGQAGQSNISSDAGSPSGGADSVDLSAAGKLASLQDGGSQGQDASPMKGMLKKVLHQVFGLDVKLVNVQQLQEQASSQVDASAAVLQQRDDNGASQSAAALSYQEQDSAELAMSGTLVTADGKQLNFSLDLSLQSRFSLQAAQANGIQGSGSQAQSFSLGNDAGNLSGAQVIASLDKLLHGTPGNSKADNAQTASNNDGTLGQAISLLAHLKLWNSGNDGQEQHNSTHTLQATALPSAKNSGTSAFNNPSKPAVSVDTHA